MREMVLLHELQKRKKTIQKNSKAGNHKRETLRSRKTYVQLVQSYHTCTQRRHGSRECTTGARLSVVPEKSKLCQTGDQTSAETLQIHTVHV